MSNGEGCQSGRGAGLAVVYVSSLSSCGNVMFCFIHMRTPYKDLCMVLSQGNIQSNKEEND